MKNLNVYENFKKYLKKRIALSSVVLGITIATVSGCKSSKDKELLKLEKNGVNVIECYKDNNYIFYNVEEIDFNKIVDNDQVLFDLIDYRIDDYAAKFYKINKSNNFAEVTYDEIIKLIEDKKISIYYKKMIIDIIKNMEKIGINNGVLYNNILNTNFIEDPNFSSGYFNPYQHTITLCKYNGRMSNFYKQMIGHEFGHMISVCVDKDGLLSAERIYLLYYNNKFEYVQLGKSLDEGYADYINYDLTGLMPNNIVGYPTVQCFYLAFKEMLNLNDMQFINANDIIEGLVKKGLDINDIIYYLNYCDNLVYYSSEMTINGTIPTGNFDTNSLMKEFILKYIACEEKNGMSDYEIREVLDKLINEYKTRIGLIDNNNKLYILSPNTNDFICLTELEETINNRLNLKNKTLN